MKIDHASLTTLRKYLDEMMYSLMDFRMSFHVEMSSLGFPTIQSLRPALRGTNSGADMTKEPTQRSIT